MDLNMQHDIIHIYYIYHIHIYVSSDFEYPFAGDGAGGGLHQPEAGGGEAVGEGLQLEAGGRNQTFSHRK